MLFFDNVCALLKIILTQYPETRELLESSEGIAVMTYIQEHEPYIYEDLNSSICVHN
jgi:hypothetical protein